MTNHPIIYFSSATHSHSAELVSLINVAYRPNQILDNVWTHESDLIEGDRINLEQLQGMLEQPHSVLVIAENAKKQIIGCVQVEKQSDYAYIGTLTIHPEYQNLGLGKQLLDYAEQYAVRQWKIHQFKMTVIKQRDALIEFYKRRGYQATGIYMDYPVDANVGIPKTDLKLEYLVKEIVLADRLDL